MNGVVGKCPNKAWNLFFEECSSWEGLESKSVRQNSMLQMYCHLLYALSSAHGRVGGA